MPPTARCTPLPPSSGLAQENMNRVAGWRFLDIGRRIERAINTCRFARIFAGEQATADDLDVLLDLIDSQITYRSRYLIGAALVAGARHGAARSVQSALGRLPDRTSSGRISIRCRR